MRKMLKTCTLPKYELFCFIALWQLRPSLGIGADAAIVQALLYRFRHHDAALQHRGSTTIWSQILVS